MSNLHQTFHLHSFAVWLHMGLEPLGLKVDLPLAGRWLSVLEVTVATLVARLLSVFYYKTFGKNSGRAQGQRQSALSRGFYSGSRRRGRYRPRPS